MFLEVRRRTRRSYFKRRKQNSKVCPSLLQKVQWYFSFEDVVPFEEEAPLSLEIRWTTQEESERVELTKEELSKAMPQKPTSSDSRLAQKDFNSECKEAREIFKTSISE